MSHLKHSDLNSLIDNPHTKHPHPKEKSFDFLQSDVQRYQRPHRSQHVHRNKV